MKDRFFVTFMPNICTSLTFDVYTEILLFRSRMAEEQGRTEQLELKETSRNLAKFPKYGWKVKLNHEFPEERNQNLKPTPGEMDKISN